MATPYAPALAPIQSLGSLRDHVLEVFECDGNDLFTVECPSCAGDGYRASGSVCTDCYGVGDLTVSDLSEVAEILDRWS